MMMMINQSINRAIKTPVSRVHCSDDAAQCQGGHNIITTTRCAKKLATYVHDNFGMNAD